MNRKQLARQLANETGLTNRKAENLVIAFGAAVTDAMEKGLKIVYSNFGTFHTVHYPSKTIPHPKWGKKKTMIMLPTNVLKWLPSSKVKKAVQGKQVESGSLTRHKKKGKLQKKVDNFENDPVEIDVRSDKSSKPSLHNNYEDDIEKYAKEKKSEKKDKPINIYEEILQDGSREISTVKGSIKAHHNKDEETADNKKDAEVTTKPVSLAGVGIFTPGKVVKEKKIPASPEEKKIDNIKSNLAETAKKLPDKAKKELKKEPEMTPIDLSSHAASSKTDVTYRSLEKMIVPKELLSKVPEKIARKFNAVPYDDKENKIYVAMIDPEDVEAKEIIKRLLGENIEVTLATESDINHILDQYQGLESEVTSAIASAEDEGVDEKKKAKDHKAQIEAASDDAPAARIVKSLLNRAIRDKASDIHIEPTEKEVEIRFRIDGVLKKRVSLPQDIQASIVSRIKILAKLKIDEQRLPQDGRFNIVFSRRRVDFRVSTMPIANGEKVVIRILDKETGILTIEKLGIKGSALTVLEENLKKTHGMILVTGPTGSGKTTTLYAMIDKIFNEGVNIVTLEDPIEYQMKGINQSQVNSGIGFTFASGLRSLVRQDPDIIMLGEIRDGETAEMAVHAALTGHVVLSTLHTNDSAGAIPRLVDMEVEPFLLTSSINAILGQRLARKICTDCKKEEVKVPERELDKINQEIKKMPQDIAQKLKEIKFVKGKGCKGCDNTGYKGRIGLFEVLNVSLAIKELVLKRTSSDLLRKKAIEEGMLTMIQDGICKALDGLITLEEVFRVTKD